MPDTASHRSAIHALQTIPDDAKVQWFGQSQSQRLIGGDPDSHYGWLERDDAVYIVNAICLDLTAYAASLLQHQRAMLKRT